MIFKLLIVFGIVACVIGSIIAMIPPIIEGLTNMYSFFQGASVYEAAGGIAAIGMLLTVVGFMGYIFYDIWKMETGRE